MKAAKHKGYFVRLLFICHIVFLRESARFVPAVPCVFRAGEQFLCHDERRAEIHLYNQAIYVVPDVENQYAAYLIGVGEIHPNGGTFALLDPDSPARLP
jgi:hypothetical protein